MESTVIEGKGLIFDLAFAGPGRLVTVDEKSAIIRHLEMTDKEQKTIELPLESEGRQVEVSNSGDLILALDGNTPKYWSSPSTNSNNESVKLKTSGVTAIGISRDGRLIATGNKNGKVQLWDLTGQEVGIINGRGPIQHIAVNSNGTRLVIADSKNAVVWKRKRSRYLELARYTHQEKISCLSLSHDGQTIALGGGDTVAIWDITVKSSQQQPIRLIGHKGDINDAVQEHSTLRCLRPFFSGTLRGAEERVQTRSRCG